MEYRLSEQELKDLMHRSWLKAKNFYSGKTDEYFYDYFESEKKQLPIHVVVKSFYCYDELVQIAEETGDEIIKCSKQCEKCKQ